jgi:hypothetical protein
MDDLDNARYWSRLMVVDGGVPPTQLDIPLGAIEQMTDLNTGYDIGRL